ncbi:MAG: ChpI protein [Candidatus Dormibacteraceae bacterium]
MAIATKKTAISIPGPLYIRAEHAARRRGITRSRLYVEALEQMLSQEEDDEITSAINEACKDLDTSMDPAWTEAQRRSLDQSWSW